VAKLQDEAMTEGLAEGLGDGPPGDRLRAANMAAGRAQAYRAVLAMLDGAS
jgi:hypothetical protein